MAALGLLDLFPVPVIDVVGYHTIIDTGHQPVLHIPGQGLVAPHRHIAVAVIDIVGRTDCCNGMRLDAVETPNLIVTQGPVIETYLIDIPIPVTSIGARAFSPPQAGLRRGRCQSSVPSGCPFQFAVDIDLQHRPVPGDSHKIPFAYFSRYAGLYPRLILTVGKANKGLEGIAGIFVLRLYPQEELVVIEYFTYLIGGPSHPGAESKTAG